MPPADLQPLLDLVRHHWGIGELRPLQEPAIRAVLAGRDSLVVLPTGGGKSLCFQAPALVRPGPTVVVSPLIALMKDQVDSLRECGITAAQFDSSLTNSERAAHEADLQSGRLKLVFVAPERLVLSGFQNMLRRAGVHTFAIDEAHCISHWGHDFRPEYRQMSRLKEWFPGASVHAYTATATQRVRDDIIVQLNLETPDVLVGDFDRPNLLYRAVPRVKNGDDQIIDVLKRHKGEAGIIYANKRKDTEDWAARLRARGIAALAYHAGLPPDERRRVQEEFLSERCDLVIATVAFGMGIDRSNLRFVLHLGLPKSLEHYQQEAGRAGRDGLEAECVLLYSAGDFVSWKNLIEKSVNESNVPVDPEFLASSVAHLEQMLRYARTPVCRHKQLVEYFGQPFPSADCGACDVCIDGVEADPESTVIAQKILSCVARVKESFGPNHVLDVLRGELNVKVTKFGHDKLSTFGLLKSASERQIRSWFDQLMDQQLLVLERKEAFVQIFRLNAASWRVMRGEMQVRLVTAAEPVAGRKSKAEAVSWEGVDSGLFETLRAVRKQYATEKAVPPYVVFGDAVLRELARVRPSTLAAMRAVSGVGDQKLREYGPAFLQAIADYCRENGLKTDQRSVPPPPPRAPSANAEAAYPLFRQGMGVDAVAQRLGRSRSTVCDYLTAYIRAERPKSLQPWVPAEVYKRVAEVIRRVGGGRLKPIYLALDEEVAYEVIRWVMAAEGAESAAAE